MNSHKTPVSLLQEVGAKRGLTPNYELLANQGPTHEPLYVFKCTAGEWEAQAKGTSKKKAKHYVALLVLYKMMKSCMENPTENNKLFVEEVRNAANGLIGNDDQLDIFAQNPGLNELLNPSAKDVPLSYPVNEEETGNPIGALQEYCQKNMWPQPTYDFKLYPQPHSSICTLKLWKWQIESTGNSRKLAKRRAALQMLDKLKMENLTIPREMLDMIEEGTLKLPEDEEPKLEGANKTISTANLIQKAYTRNLKGVYNSKGQSIVLTPNEKKVINTQSKSNGLPSPDEDLSSQVNVVDTVQQVCDRYNLTPVYTYMANMTKSRSVYCLLQLNTDPVQIIQGVGKNVETARQDSAKKCLSFLENMTNPVILRDS